jgi:ABC-type dipeptide/oligopeptide/nickel transport system permease component
VLANGSVLVVGGFYSDGTGGGMDILATTFEFDPKAKGWTQVGDLPQALQGPKGLSALGDGRALVIAGFKPTNVGIFMPASGGWVIAGEAPEAAWSGFATTALPDGRLLFSGGNVGQNPTTDSFIFDPMAVASSGGPGDRLAWLRQPAAWVAIAAGSLLLALVAMLLASRRPRAWRWARPFIAAIFQIAGLFLFTWLLVQAAGLAPPPTSNGDVAGAARVGELSLLKQPIPVIIAVASLRSLILVALAALWATFIGVGTAVAAVSLRKRWLDVVGGSVALLWVAPTFLLAILVQEMQAFLYGHTGLVVAAGFGDVNAAQVFWSSVVLALRPATYLYSQTRQALDVELREQYTRTALAKGVPYRWMVLHHALAAATGRVLAVWLNSLRLMVGALPLVEFFFGYPGLGRVLILSLGLTYAGSAGAANSNLVVALLVTMGALLIVAEAIASMVKTATDPRLRRAGMAA